MQLEMQLKALSNPIRVQILEWLKEPAANFRLHESGRSFDNGICVAYLQEKTGLSQSATSQYMYILYRADFVIPTRIGKWTYYRRNEQAIVQFMSQLDDVMTLSEKQPEKTEAHYY